MKRLFFAILFPAFSYCQKAPSLFQNTTDKFTGEVTMALIHPIIISLGGRNGVLIDFSRTSRTSEDLTFIIQDNDFGCTLSGTDHIVYFLFADGSRYSAYNSAKGCKGEVFIFLTEGTIMNKYLASELMVKNVASIRVASSKGNFDFDLTKPIAAKIRAAAMELFGETGNKGDMADSSAHPLKRTHVAAPTKVDINENP